MKSVIAFSAVLASASAFVPSASFVGSPVSSVARPASSTAVSMAASDMVGASAPLGFFDPMGFSKGPAERLNAYRESELKHGRTAMLAVVGFLTQENWHPLYNGGLSSNPVKAITEVPPEGLFQASYRCCCCCCRSFWLCWLVVLTAVCCVVCVGDVGSSVFQAASGSSVMAMVLLHTLFSRPSRCV
ncbi:unnamed protein product [Ectocarpus sp. 8 AP-2014]